MRATDVAEWLGGPSLFVLDCPCAGRLVRALARRGADAATAGGAAAAAAAAPVVLGATEADEWLPVADDFPADVFTACLTRPLEPPCSSRCARRSAARRRPPPPAAQLLAALPGSLGDRRSPLGELTWVLTAITDSIAWQLLPPALFRRLFRQDVLLSALLRNFVLASRVMHTLHCSVVSHPPLPPMHDHPLWEVWDHTVDLCLAQRPPAPYSLTPFFTEQLSAFELAVAHAAAARRRRATAASGGRSSSCPCCCKRCSRRATASAPSSSSAASSRSAAGRCSRRSMSGSFSTWRNCCTRRRPSCALAPPRVGRRARV